MNTTHSIHPFRPAYRVADRLLAGLAFSLAILGSFLAIATFVLWLVNGTTADIHNTLASLGDLLTALACCVVAGLILVQRARQPIGWLLLTIGLLWGFEWFGEAYGRYAFLMPGVPLPAADLIYWLSLSTWVPGFGLWIWLILLFPSGRLLAPGWGWVGVLASLCTLPITVMFARASWPLRGEMLYRLQALEEPLPVTVDTAPLLLTLDSPWVYSLLVAFLLLIPAALCLFIRLRQTHSIERQQVKWFAFAASFFASTMALLAILNLLAGPDLPTAPLWTSLWELLYIVAPPFLPVSIGIAILRYRLWDIDILIQRTLLYTGLTALATGCYLLIVGGLGALLTFTPAVAQPESGLTLWQGLPLQLLAAGAVAVLFHPVRQRLQRSINRLFYGEIDEPYTVIARLGQQLENTLAPQHVLTTIVETVRSALKLPYVGVQVANSDLPLTSSAVNAGTSPPPALTLTTLPLVHQGEHVGDLLIAPRSGEVDFSPRDRELLAGLARQAGAAIQSVRLTADLQNARQRLVTAREEERRRLRRDLHDGLGASLASIAMQIDAARSLVDEAPDASKLMLGELTEQVQETIADVRRLIYNLRPPALDDVGLAGALRQLAATHANKGLHIELIVPEVMPSLTAAVEVAIYRIVQEALTNVVRHAQARRCRVHLSIDETPAALRLLVEDDGIGLFTAAQPGVGLHSMRERAEELDGSFSVMPAPSGGTKISVTLPIG